LVEAKSLWIHIDDAHYRLTDEHIEGAKHVKAQADRGEFAADAEVKEIFGQSL